MAALIIRGTIYIVAAIGLGLLFTNEPQLASGWRPFTEYGYVQVAQAAMLFIGSLMLFVKARQHPDYRQLSLAMALFFLVLFIRENDQPIELLLPHGAWKFIALPLVLVLVVYGLKHFRKIIEQLLEWSGGFSFGVMIAGFTVLVYARFFGKGELWQLLMGDQFIRQVKNAAEEGMELLALGLILIAIFEFFLVRRKAD